MGWREDGKHWFLWLRLHEPSREAAAAYWSHLTLKMLHQRLMRSKMHFPRRCFMSKEGGHKCLFELWSGIETVYWFATLWRDDYIAKTSEIEHRWQPKRGLSVLLWMEWTENTVKKHYGLEDPMFWKPKIRPIHAHTNTHIPNFQGSELVYGKHTEQIDILRCMPACTYKCIHTHCLFVYAWLFSTTIFHSSFVSPLVYSNRL